jgi:anti-sigma-K factor RskA
LQVAALEKQVGQQSASLDLVMDPAVRVSQMTDPSGATKGAAKVYWHDTKKTGLVVVSNLQAVIKGQGKDLELWAFCGDKPPVPAGLFWTDATGHGVAEIKLVKELACVSKFAVTIEPAGGVQVATGPVVLLGP